MLPSIMPLVVTLFKTSLLLTSWTFVPTCMFDLLLLLLLTILGFNCRHRKVLRLKVQTQFWTTFLPSNTDVAFHDVYMERLRNWTIISICAFFHKISLPCKSKTVIAWTVYVCRALVAGYCKSFGEYQRWD